MREDKRDTEAYIVKIATAPVESTTAQELREMVSEMGPVSLQTVPLQHVAIKDLTSGGLQAIEDASLRRRVFAYDRALEFDALRQRRLEDWFYDRAGPYDEVNADLVGMSTSLGFGWSGRNNLQAATAFQLARAIRAREFLLAELENLLTTLTAST